MPRTKAPKKLCEYCGMPITQKRGGKKYFVHEPSERRFCSMRCYGLSVSKERPRRKNDRLYSVWMGMRERCRSQKHISARFYQERGITVCDEWNDSFPAFREWALQNGYDYSKSRKEQSLDRIDNAKGYSPDNCRWVSMVENNQNTRRNVNLEYNGKTQCASAWSRELNIPLTYILTRARLGMTLSEIVSLRKGDRRCMK